MSMYSTVMNFSGKEKRVAIINYDESEIASKTTSVSVNQLHHIHILDRSGSMQKEINNLIDAVKETIAAINENDLISIIWFASPGQYRTLIKGAKKTDALDALLDTLRSVMGTTCFSDPLAEVKTVIDELWALCPNISVTLFTDGCPVVPWSIEEEEKRVFSILETIKDKIISFNTIGFGNWYNKELLTKMATFSEYGTFCHSNKIQEYLNIFNHNFEKINDMILDSVDIKFEGKIIYLNRNFTKMEDGVFTLTRLNKRKNQFILIGQDSKHFEFEYQNKVVSTSGVDNKVAAATVANIYYSYAYNLYYSNCRTESLDILANDLKDKFLVDSHFNSFTYDESANHIKLLNDSLFNTKDRYKTGICSNNYIPKNDETCIMDILHILQSENALYVPFSKNVESYKRISRKTTDTYNAFTPNTDEITVPFNNFVYNKDHMNLSIRVIIPGKVKLNPKSAQTVNLPEEIDSHIFRNYTIIKDGTLNIKEIEVLLLDDTFAKIDGISHIINKLGVVDNYTRCILRLDTLPIINRMYIKQSEDISNIFDYVLKISNLEARQKVIKFYLDKAITDSPIGKKSENFKDFTNDQIQLLTEYGLDKNFTYSGINKVTSSISESDSYTTRTMSFYISGCTTWPKIDDVIKNVESKKKLTISAEIIEQHRQEVLRRVTDSKLDINKSTSGLRKLLDDILLENKNELSNARDNLNALKMAKIVTGDWFPGLVPNDKGEYEYTKDGITMKTKILRTVEYF